MREKMKPKEEPEQEELGGLVLGWDKNQKKMYVNTDDAHSLVIGATRCGKTRHLVLESIGATALAEESMVITDPKSELYLYTHEFLERQGYEVIAIDFVNPKLGNRYNFYSPCSMPFTWAIWHRRHSRHGRYLRYSLQTSPIPTQTRCGTTVRDRS